ncbi:MAG: acyltransferase family protein [Nocardioidaceae bacterium]|nr:acyltransferase family protein [Nocardioidaceae bacterium]
MTDTARAEQAPAPAAAPVARDPLWDNLRWVAITLVVVGHTIEVPNQNDLAFGLYLTIYAFHMPLFAFAAGRFAKAERFTTREGAVLLRQVVAPYVVFQVLWAAMGWVQGSEVRAVDFATPSWHLWFLVALAVWRLTLPVLAATRFPVTIAVVISCASGLWATVGTPMAASRTLVFLPFFVAGWALHQRGWSTRAIDVLRRPAVRVLALLVMAGTVAGSIRYADFAREYRLRKWVQGEWNYDRLQFTEWWTPGVRLAAIVVAFGLIACAIALVPRGEIAISRGGRRTMTVYLLHLFPIAVAGRQGWFLADVNTNTQVLVLVAVAVAWSALLSTRAVEWLASPLVSPPVEWLLRPAERRGRRRRAR